MPRKDKEKTAHKIGMTPVILLFIIIIAAGCTGLKNLKDNLTNIPTNMYGEVQQNLPGNVYGMTRNMAHAPVEGVSILIRGNSSSYSGLTDANGIYNISGVPPGFYDIFAWKEGRALRRMAFYFLRK